MIQNIKRASCKVKIHTKESSQMTHLTYFLYIFAPAMWMQVRDVNAMKRKAKNKYSLIYFCKGYVGRICKLSWPGGYGADGLSENSGRTYGLVLSAPPPQQCQASHILCKYALLRSFTGAFSPVQSPHILISQVTVVGFKPVCAADITTQALQINLGTLSLHF